MSRSLSFESDPVDQPAASDALERATWCALRVRVGDRFASRIWDRELNGERTTLYVPAFPIAEWIANNWWFLFHEPCRWEAVPRSVGRPAEFDWTRRHCLRAADSALLLPNLFVFHDGHGPRVEWRPDASGSLPNMPGEFIGYGAEPLDAGPTQSALGEFVRATLGRVSHLPDERALELATLWRSIEKADEDERQFCTLAGTMGIDPYDPDTMTEELASFLEEAATEHTLPLVLDLAKVSGPGTIEERWSWIVEASRELGMLSGPRLRFPDLPSRDLSPAEFGYELARKVRRRLSEELGPLPSVEELGPLPSVEEAANRLLAGRFRVVARNHVPGKEVQAIVGMTLRGEVIAAGPEVPSESGRRFQVARRLFHALIGRESCPRLVTRGFSWDQKASRAFAAELLAPQRALMARLADDLADAQFIDQAAGEFQVSSMVVQRQLENAGAGLSAD
ncbi:hypothetical protein OJF2_48760 [Aquisphaera giovannonii]|uniref:IrrE N-terminal-like domain-containing protein n=1 Tax=Aquisphaera giovannonii TaxID=406548 RepID=A0A5B9W8A6_9BACT|nr:hypothetical protein [Aquisphaera giovannonii]QEH36315.1 hypothetical protein OJF2_48760 [Aquisphaera giovannonii]